ncbi:MAG: DUF885 family protein, partial [Candidatus Krumholzibacteriia bacterium]
MRAVRVLGVSWVLVLAGGTVQAETASKALAKLAREYWEAELRANPVHATSLGDRRYDHLLPDETPEARARERAHLTSLRERAAALDPASLSGAELIDRSMLLEVLDGRLAVLDCGFPDWVVDPLDGPQIFFQNIPSLQPVGTPAQARAMVQRWRAMGPYLDAHIANLRTGLENGRAATSDQVRRVLEQLDETLAADVETWALLSPLQGEHADWPGPDRDAFERDLRAAVRNVVRPAFTRYRDFLESDVLPVARPQDEVGLAHLPDGDACYRAMIRHHTSLDLPAAEIHRIGKREVSRIMGEMRALGSRVLGTDDLDEILSRLRGDPALYFETRDGVENKAREALERAQEAVHAYFGILPQAACVVVRMEPHEEKHSTIAYYRQPALDGSRPGRYYINTYAPETRPRYEAEALAFHEAIPGHHLQIAVAQELTGIPEFRKHTGTTAFVEGWALYTEQLSDEMGLYSG